MFRYFKDLDKLANALRVEHFATMGDELKCFDSQDPAIEVLAWMKANDFDIVPVVQDGKKSFFVDREKDLKDIADGKINDYMQPIPFNELVEPNELIKVALELLSERGWFFVGTGNVLEGIVTLEDFGRPAVSFYLLAKLLMVESGLRRLCGTYTNNPTTDSPSKDGVDGDPKYFKDVIKRIKKHSEEAKLTNKPDLRADLERLKVTLGNLSSMAALRDEIAHGRNILSFAKDANDVVKRNEKIDKVLAAISRLDDNRKQMWKAYEDTFVKHTLSEDFWVGSNIVDLPPDLLSSSAIYIISAENPSGEVLPKGKNTERTNALRDVLNGRRSKNNDGKWRYEEVVGQSPDGDWKQYSFAVGDISEEEACELAKEMFGQRAVFEITQEYIRVIPTDPKDKDNSEYIFKNLPRKRE
jgi:predicted transcriptional regulator